jgi:hypothetical protein
VTPAASSRANDVGVGLKRRHEVMVDVDPATTPVLGGKSRRKSVGKEGGRSRRGQSLEKRSSRHVFVHPRFLKAES